jgi:glutathione synthase/RimK-type ligase-like ATP-grasp enzyme
MRIAIHHREGSFSGYWIDWCKRHDVDHLVVDAYRSDLIDHLRATGCDAFMWHWHHSLFADQLFARQLTLALETAGIKTFPSVRTAWHYDDKLGQKYLLEAAELPSVEAHVFYDPREALRWLETCPLPVVHKLRGGAGGQSVRLVRDRAQARRLVKRAFGRGFAPVDLWALAKDSVWRMRRDRTLKSVFRVPYAFLRALFNVKPRRAALRPPERGYVYFQEFIPDNEFDDRYAVIGERCFCVRRLVPKNDFRASGSGLWQHDKDQFPLDSIRLAFEVADRIGSQSVAMDMIYDDAGRGRIVELSYAFPVGPFLERTGGYFDRYGEWHDTSEPPPTFMVADLVASLR